MKIGIDLDGVIFDSEKWYRIYSELYDMLDSYRNCKKIADSKIETIYLKDAPSYDLENEYVKMLYNWGEIYRYIKNNYR